MKTTLCAAAAATILAGSAMAGEIAPQVIEVDISNLVSFDGLGAPGNETLSINLPEGYDRVIGIGWDVVLETYGASWASEASIALGDSVDGAALFLSPASGEDAPLGEPTAYSSGGIVDLIGLGLDFSVASGVLSLELFEGFDDVAGEADAAWLAGSTISVQVIPAPGAIALLGAAGLIGTRRRRG